MDASPNHRGNVPLVLQSAAGRSGANFLSSTSGSGVEQVERSPTAWVVEKPVDMMDSRRDYIMQHLDSAVVDKLSYLQTDYEVSACFLHGGMGWNDLLMTMCVIA